MTAKAEDYQKHADACAFQPMICRCGIYLLRWQRDIHEQLNCFLAQRKLQFEMSCIDCKINITSNFEPTHCDFTTYLASGYTTQDTDTNEAENDEIENSSKSN